MPNTPHTPRPPFILALDEGTTSTRSILFDQRARPLATHQQPLNLSYPKSGWVECDADQLFRAQLATAEACVKSSSQWGGLSARHPLACLSITNQRETTILWDRKSGDPIVPAIVWQDRRTAPECEALRAAGHEDLVRQRTGLLIDPYFSATKLAWLLDHAPGARDRANKGDLAAGTVESWLIFKLTRGHLHISDASNASRTMLLNIHTADWDDDLLRLLNIPREVLPKVVGTQEIIGEVSCGSPLDGTPIAGLAGDQQAALFGQLCHAPGKTKSTYGTGAFVLQSIGTKPTLSTNRLLTTIAHKGVSSGASVPSGAGFHPATRVPSGAGFQPATQITYALEGSAFIAGAVVQWLRDGLGIIQKSSDVEPLASTVSDSGGVYFVPAFVGLGAPYWDPYARGLIIGLTRDTTAAHIARAAIESITHQVADLVEALTADSNQPLPDLRVDGGAAANNALLQFQSDLLQVPVTRPKNIETTALGAAFLGGLATGVWKSAAELEQLWQPDRTFEPQMSKDQAANLRHNWKQAVNHSRNWTRETRG
jgi:glycerol kinase